MFYNVFDWGVQDERKPAVSRLGTLLLLCCCLLNTQVLLKSCDHYVTVTHTVLHRSKFKRHIEILIKIIGPFNYYHLPIIPSSHLTINGIYIFAARRIYLSSLRIFHKSFMLLMSLMNMNELLAPLGVAPLTFAKSLPLVGGGLLGFATGFAIKKIVKLAFIALGLLALLLGYLEYQRWITVNWTVAENQSSAFMTHAVNKISVITQQIGHEVPIAAGVLGFAPGLVLGLYKG